MFFSDCLFIAKFVYNNIKNINTSFTLFKLNCDYYSHIFYQDNINPYSNSYLTNKLANELKYLMFIYQ